MGDSYLVDRLSILYKENIEMSNFVCKRCGKCCGFVPFTKKEYNNIRKEAKELNISFEKSDMFGKTVYFPKKLFNKFTSINENISIEEMQQIIGELTCPFLERNALGLCSCKIYDKRPEVCRLFGNGKHPRLICPNNRGI